MRLLRPVLGVLLLQLSCAVVDENGRYKAGTDIMDLVPEPPTEEEKEKGTDLSKEPPERLFRLLAYELMIEEKRPPERRLGVREFQSATELSCPETVVQLFQDAERIEEDVRLFSQNITGTSGLFWLLHKFPEEHSWTWLIANSMDRAMKKVVNHLVRLAVAAANDHRGCLSPSFRSTLMNMAGSWKRLHSDYIALMWNGIAFGVLGDVTAWREVDEDGVEEQGPGGEPPNVSWSENLIFNNMYLTSIQKWTERNTQELRGAAEGELQYLQAGVPVSPHEVAWRRGENGVLSPFELLRRQMFGGWELDKGLLRGVLKHCLRPSYDKGVAKPALADFGAGAGSYSEWLNSTGLVDAFAVDAAGSVHEITGGVVAEVNLASEAKLWRTFDWVLSLQVAEHVPLPHAKALLQNAKRHAEKGLIMSWSSDKSEASHALPEAEFAALVQQETGFVLNRQLTEKLRAGCELDRIAKSVAVFEAPLYPL